MTYIPVGTRLTYTATVSQGQVFSGFTTWEDLSAKLKTDLPNLPGMEELDVSSVNGNDEFFHVLQGKFSISMDILNNGVDHGNEFDIQSIIDGTIQSYGNQIIGSNITKIVLPDNPDDGSPQVINTGATPNAAPASTPTSSGGFNFPSLSGGSIAGISITLIVIALIALVLLLPGNARRLVSG